MNTASQAPVMPRSHPALRALRFALPSLLVLGLVALLTVQSRINDRARFTGCPPATPEALACLGGLQPSSLTLELAGSGHQLACQLRSVAGSAASSMPTPSERFCIEAQVQTRWDELETLDARLFMPIYGLYSLLVAAWIALQSRAGSGALERRPLVAAMGIVVTTILLLVLDARENAHALALLVDAERGPLSAPHHAAMDAAASAARSASLHKWAASAVWAAMLAWGLAQWKEARRPLQRWPRLVAILAAAAAASLFAVAVVVAACQPEALEGPVHHLQNGLVLAFLSMAAVAVAAAATRDPAQAHTD
ncbi:MAG: hypothetical protein Q7V20_10095 [Aquabacterium sp.]|uniref:hypothetical protein n=1 Tax=Aquabacterium sp. TaxID=1872578 RepID=UPI002727B37F|nr:hypothetical protein [Aquabacterium sp.]MDO9003791.1 hypothetical protein [Aquabacterium sp.]